MSFPAAQVLSGKEQERHQGRTDLPDKVQNFQVRIRIIAGRQLYGNNMKPVVKVLLGSKVHQTRVRRGNNPHFNEIFFQDFHQKPSQLFEEPVYIQVLNSHVMKADSIIGVFKLDIGSVYNAPGHVILRKWLSLHEPDNVSSGVKGYLKISLYVLGAGDSVPVDEECGPDDDDDVESNLLTPSSFQTHTASVCVKVFTGEDIPQLNYSMMNNVRKLLSKEITVDPYVKVSFAGKTLKTKVSKINANPEWNQMMSFPVQLPPLCDQLKLTVYDWDMAGSDEALGSAFLSISQVSSIGSEVEGDYMGFPPSFGPSFLTLYGSPREFSGIHDPLQSLNEGMGEGVAYRGRLLLEVQTCSEEKPMLRVEEIPKRVKRTTEWLKARRKFALAAVFYSATMLPEVKTQVQFEVSMGNYGNKFDMTCKPVFSTTQYSQAVFDGNYYYYLPWYDTKPVVAVTSEWEDVTHRLHALNMLQSLHHKLEHLGVLHRESSADHLDSSWKWRLEEVKMMCRQTLPLLDGLHSTSLDRELYTLRSLFLQEMGRSMQSLLEKPNPGPDLLTQLEDWLQRLTDLTHEPQVSLPDVMIWMLVQDKRVAYTRMCAADILYSPHGANGRGIHCGKLQTIFLKHLPGLEKTLHVPVVLRLRLWLSLMSDIGKLDKHYPGKICVCVETYENQARCFGRWSSKALGCHPLYSDITGKLSAPRERFQPPKGWLWEGNWQAMQQRRLLMDSGTNYREEVVEEVYENQSRTHGGPWIPALISNTSASGTQHHTMEEIVCPPGWHFVRDWKMQRSRAMDDMGWEYGIGFPSSWAPVSWSAVEKTYHTHRRRHWQRLRERDAGEQTSDTEHSEEKAQSACWEYTTAFEWKFHQQQKSSDMFRRRCWRRSLVPLEGQGASSIFLLEESMELKLDKPDHDKSKETKNQSRVVLQNNTPLIYCVFKGPTYYQLRCYMYQARCLLSANLNSFSDPYAQVAFLHVSQRTDVQPCTLTPFWDQTLLFSDVLIYGDPKSVMQEPPCITVELFDKNQMGKDKFLGRSLCYPIVCLNVSSRVLPRLKWNPVKKGERSGGEVLAAFELLLDEKDRKLDSIPTPHRKHNGSLVVPKAIRPTLRLMEMEILTWGVREMKTFHLLSVQSPSLLVECGGESIQTPPIKNIKQNPNFPTSLLRMKVYLPEEKYYFPPIELKVLDNRPFGYKPLVGQTSIWDLQPYYDALDKVIAPALPARVVSAEHTPKVKKPNVDKNPEELEEEEPFDWWIKFFASLGELNHIGTYLEKGHDILKIYDMELESVPTFRGFQDFCQTFKLHRGRSLEGDTDEDPLVVGEVKASFRIYPLPEDPKVPIPPAYFQHIPESCPQECLVRVYIVRALDLLPCDRNGLCDPYLQISLGKKRLNNRDNYHPNTLNPVFGKLFELSCVIPLEKDLKVSVFDYDVVSSDDMVGETVIDLENRLLSRFGANCGLPQTYSVSGPNPWRNQLLPSKLLHHLCRVMKWDSPRFTKDGLRVTVENTKRYLSQFEEGDPKHSHLGPAKERLSLHVLRSLGQVPEHVETRILRNPVCPRMEQGKLQMWVDIFPRSLGVPGRACVITPKIPKKYVLRCIVWNTEDVDLQESNIFGEKMSDIYVKGWMDGLEGDKQQTDIHYRSLDGSGNFNWRFVFHFEYLSTEQVCVIQKKDHLWSLDKITTKLPPKLIIQVWDNDKFSFDDFLARNPERCSLKTMQRGGTSWRFLRFLKLGSTPTCFISLFKQKAIRGWWPCSTMIKGKPRLSGKVELTLELVTEKEAEERPAGKGREEPNTNPKLDPPIICLIIPPFQPPRHLLPVVHVFTEEPAVHRMEAFSVALLDYSVGVSSIVVHLLFSGLHIVGPSHPQNHKG
ncbi:myoferlin-like isoform X3 [Ascaphus truei]|uniref:myoferlin-like isoform X3 n=1 Tax=Ascaphus truei TaxID=8439 RepID=UPI003F5940E5